MAAPAKKVSRPITPVTVSSKEASASPDITLARGAQDIAALAYQYWQARGYPDGSSEEDWFRAERDIQCRS